MADMGWHEPKAASTIYLELQDGVRFAGESVTGHLRLEAIRSTNEYSKQIIQGETCIIANFHGSEGLHT